MRISDWSSDVCSSDLADRTDIGEELQVVLQPVEFARGGGAHRALRALELDPGIHAAALADAVELAEAALEDRFQPADVAVALAGAGVELGQIGRAHV